MLIKNEFRDALWDDDIKRKYILPARGNGKSMLQAEMYKELMKGDINMCNFFKRGDKITADALKQIEEFGKTSEVNEPKAAEEEWIWVKGYKGTDRNMVCMSYQYDLEKQFNMEDGAEIKKCQSGFHFCKDLRNVFGYYNIGIGNRFFEVEALVRKSDWAKDVKTYADFMYTYRPYGSNGYNDDKFAAKSIRFIRELTVGEVFEAYKRNDDAIATWTDDQKKRAMETTIDKVKAEIRTEDLVSVGYSRPFAMYIGKHSGRYAKAMAVASQPELSMDVKVLAIFLDE